MSRQNSRYIILERENEFLKDFIGCKLDFDKTTSQNVSNSKIMQYITKELFRIHYEKSKIFSSAKVLLWETDDQNRIKQLSASCLIYDKKEKKIFPDIINHNFGNIIAEHFMRACY